MKRNFLKSFLCILICLTLVARPVTVRAEVADDDDYFGELDSLDDCICIDSGTNDLIHAASDDDVSMQVSDGKITYTRKHIIATTKLSYETTHFIVSASEIKEDDTGINQTGSGIHRTTKYGVKYGVMEKKEVQRSDVNTVTGERTSYYGFSVQELNDIAKDIGVKPHEGDPVKNPGETKGTMYVTVWFSHVFRCKPTPDTAAGMESWIKSAGNKYKGLTNDLSWYSSYKDFYYPKNETGFWSGGKSVDKMRLCVNIKLTVPYIASEIPIEVYVYDVNAPENVSRIEKIESGSVTGGSDYQFSLANVFAINTMFGRSDLNDDVYFVRQKTIDTSTGTQKGDAAAPGSKEIKVSKSVDTATGICKVKTRTLSKGSSSVQVWVPIANTSINLEPKNELLVFYLCYDTSTNAIVGEEKVEILSQGATAGKTKISELAAARGMEYDDASGLWGVYASADDLARVTAVGAVRNNPAEARKLIDKNRYATYKAASDVAGFTVPLESRDLYSVYIPLKKAGGNVTPATPTEAPSPTPTEAPSPTPAPAGEPAKVKIVYFDPSTNKPVDTEDAPDAAIGQTGYAASLDASAIPGGYEIDTANTSIGYAAYGKTDTVYTTYNKGTKYSNISITATAFTINDTIVKASSTTKIALWVPVKKQPKVTVPVAVTIVYYNPATKAVVGTDSAGEGQEGQKNFSAILDVKGKCGENYSVDTASTAYAAYGSTNNVITTYDKGTKYASVNCTTTKFTIKSELKKADFTAMWVPVKSGVPVTVKYVDRSGNVINIDDGGVTEKNKEYHYTVDPSIPGSSYTVKPDESYLKNGGNKKPLSSSGNDVSINKFPYDTATELYVPCDTKAVPTPIPSTYSWDYMDTQANAAGRCIIKSDDFDVEVAIPSSENEYGQVTAAKYLTRGGISSHIGTRSYTVTVKQKAYRYWYDYDTTPVYETDPVTGAVVTDAYGNPVQAKDAYGFPKWDRGPDYQVSDSGYRTATITVELPWKWYSLDEYVLYKFVSATLTNGSADMPFEITPSLGDTISASSSVSGAESDHVKDPAGWTGTGMTITLSGSISSSSTGYSAPDWPNINLAAAESTVRTTLGEMQVKNDSLTLNGNVILNGSSWKTYSNLPEPDMSKVKASSTTTAKSPKQRIPDERSNMEYVSGGQLEYAMVGSYGSTMSDPYWSPVNVNSVKVHTPVTVKATFSDDNLKYNQKTAYDSSRTQIVIGRVNSSTGTSAADNPNMTSDFIIKLEHNKITHNSYKGYGLRDYTKYVLSDQIKFPFDCIIDIGTDYKENNDKLVKAGEWYEVPSGVTSLRCYVPEWATEGNYDVQIRTIAINGTEISPSAEKANLNASQYIATATQKVQISGKMYNFTLYDISSKTSEWSDVFRLGTTLKYLNQSKYLPGIKSTIFDKNKTYYYKSGTRNEAGVSSGAQAMFGLPLVNGSNPKTTALGTLKAGYVWRFKLDTVGSSMASDVSRIVIKPTFWWVDEEGKNRTKVHLYYTETFGGSKHSLVRIGGSLDQTNLKSDYAANSDFGISKNELEITSKIKGNNLKTWVNTKGVVYGYSSLTSNNLFKTYVNEPYYNLLNGYGLTGTMSKNEIIKDHQSWYFEYSLPEFHATEYDGTQLDNYIKSAGSINYKESFWKTDGYIIVNFDISAYDAYGNKIMSYENAANASLGACNMWLMEYNGTATGKKSVSEKKSKNPVTFSFEPGDVFMVYADPSKMASSDYSQDHLN